MKLVHSRPLADRIWSVLHEVDRLDLLTCYTDARWFTSRGALSELTTWLHANPTTHLRVLLGTDPLLRPAQELLAWVAGFDRPCVEVRRSDLVPRKSLHAKAYLAYRSADHPDGPAMVRGWIGSNNLTQRGMSGPKRGNVELAVQIAQARPLDDLHAFFESQWANASPMELRRPPPPPRPTQFEDHVVRQLMAGTFWGHRLSVGRSEVTISPDVVGVLSKSNSVGDLTLTRQGQVRWKVFGPQTRAIRNHHQRARQRMKEHAYPTAWGLFVPVQGEEEWTAHRMRLEQDFKVMFDGLMATLEDREQVVENLTAWVRAIRKQVRGNPKAHLPPGAASLLDAMVTDTLHAMRTRMDAQPVLKFHSVPTHIPHYRKQPARTPERESYEATLRSLVLQSFLAPREALLADSRRKADCPAGLIQDPKLQKLHTRVRRTKRDRARFEAAVRKQIDTIHSQHTVSWAAFLRWGKAFSEWTAPKASVEATELRPEADAPATPPSPSS